MESRRNQRSKRDLGSTQLRSKDAELEEVKEPLGETAIEGLERVTTRKWAGLKGNDRAGGRN